MRYALLIYADEDPRDSTPKEVVEQMYAEYDKYGAWLQEKGWMRGGEELASTKSATTVRVQEGKVVTIDGPFAETKEQLAGFFLIECDDLDQAIEAASKVPSAPFGSIEVRPLTDQGGH
ncbi:MAG TPA: YciI family protein [Actinomycetota bacterium]|nr:YciI family protein [Actinomycetota bacterium]